MVGSYCDSHVKIIVLGDLVLWMDKYMTGALSTIFDLLTEATGVRMSIICAAVLSQCLFFLVAACGHSFMFL